MMDSSYLKGIQDLKPSLCGAYMTAASTQLSPYTICILYTNCLCLSWCCVLPLTSHQGCLYALENFPVFFLSLPASFHSPLLRSVVFIEISVDFSQTWFLHCTLASVCFFNIKWLLGCGARFPTRKLRVSVERKGRKEEGRCLRAEQADFQFLEERVGKLPCLKEKNSDVSGT